MLRDRIPPVAAILSVYAVIAFMVFGWTILNFLWEFSSWIFFLTTGEILTIFAYSMVSDLLESLAILGFLLLVCLILPADWLRHVFSTRATIAVIFGLGFIMFFVYRYTAIGFSFVSSLPAWSWGGLALTLIMTVFSTRIRALARVADWLSDRLIVFLFILIPVSLISLISIIYRNIF